MIFRPFSALFGYFGLFGLFCVYIRQATDLEFFLAKKSKSFKIQLFDRLTPLTKSFHGLARFWGVKIIISWFFGHFPQFLVFWVLGYLGLRVTEVEDVVTRVPRLDRRGVWLTSHRWSPVGFAMIAGRVVVDVETRADFFIRINDLVEYPTRELIKWI